MNDRVRVAFGVAFVAFGVLAVVVGGGAYAFAWYSAVAWSQSDEARRAERAAIAPPPIWLDEGGAPPSASLRPDGEGAGVAAADPVSRRAPTDAAAGLGAAALAGDEEGGANGSAGTPRVTSGATVFAPPQLRHVLEDAEREAAVTSAGLPQRRAAASDVGVANVDFRFLDPPEPGAHARLQLSVRNRADVPTGPVSVTIPARWFESFDVLGAVPGVLLDRVEHDGLRYFDYPAIGPSESATLELHVLASNEDLDAPEVRVILRDEEAEVARAQPRTVAPKPRPGPARQLQIPSLNIRSGVVPTAWEPPDFVVGQIRDSAAVSLGNTVLVGHLRGPAGDVFNRLDRVKLGDEVTAVSRGVEFRFVVSEVVVLPNNDNRPMLPTETPRLTMMTCAGIWNPFSQDYSHRIWVIAEPPELAEQTIAANRERAARAAEELARIQAEAERAEAEQAAADATATAIAEAARPDGVHADEAPQGGANVDDPAGAIQVGATAQAATEQGPADRGVVAATPTVEPVAAVDRRRSRLASATAPPSPVPSLRSPAAGLRRRARPPGRTPRRRPSGCRIRPRS